MNKWFCKWTLACAVCLLACLAMNASSDSSKVIYKGKGFSLERAKDPYAGHVSKPATEEVSPVKQEQPKTEKVTAAESKKELSSPKKKAGKETTAKSKKKSGRKSKSKAKLAESNPAPVVDQPADDSQDSFFNKEKFKAWFKNHVPWYVKLGVLALIIILIMRYLVAIGSSCPRCNKKSAMQEVDKEIISEKASNIKVRSKNRIGDTEGYIDQRVPATIYTYKITHRCRFCGYEEVSYESEKIED